MHIFVLVLVVFLHAQPATATASAIAAHAETKSVVVPNAAACDLAGNLLVSQFTQDPVVSFAGYACVPVDNSDDKAS